MLTINSKLHGGDLYDDEASDAPAADHGIAAAPPAQPKSLSPHSKDGTPTVRSWWVPVFALIGLASWTWVILTLIALF